MVRGRIIKALSGFYYVDDGVRVLTCRARGKFRRQGESPLVGDEVRCTPLEGDTGVLDEILPRRNSFTRPAVANIDQLVVVVSETNPVTDPFLIDRVVCLAEHKGCRPLICVNKRDLSDCDRLVSLYTAAGLPTLWVSAETGEGIEGLRREISGKVNAFTGNSGVGKSSLLNRLAPGLGIPTGEVSDRLGRGRHTTRHIQLYRLDGNTLIADTPGFSSFDVEEMEQLRKEELADTFREFRPYLGRCRFHDCAQLSEKGCAVLAAVRAGEIPRERHDSYVRLYRQLAEIPDWERK